MATGKPINPSRIAKTYGFDSRECAAECLVLETVEKLMFALRRSKTYKVAAKVSPTVKISFNPRRRKSYGGTKGLRFALNHFVNLRVYGDDGIKYEPVSEDYQVTLKEYTSFADSPDIGTISGNWRLIVRVLVAHELAHWIQYTKSVTKPADVDYRKPHGVGFQEIYYFLRSRV